MRTVALFEMLFGLLALAGGIIDYAGHGDVVSLIVGIVAGLLILIAGLSMQKGSRKALYTELILALGIIGFYGREFFMLHEGFFPGGIISILGIISLLLLLILLVQPKERKRIF